MDWVKRINAIKSGEVSGGHSTSLPIEMVNAIEKIIGKKDKEPSTVKETPVPIKANSIAETIKQIANVSNKSVVIDYPVVGVTFEGRQSILRKYFDENYKTGKRRNCRLELEDDNKYDKNAVAVYIIGDSITEKIGYISKDHNQFIRKEYAHIDFVRVKSIGLSDNSNIGLSITVTFKNKV